MSTKRSFDDQSIEADATLNFLPLAHLTLRTGCLALSREAMQYPAFDVPLDTLLSLLEDSRAQAREKPLPTQRKKLERASAHKLRQR